MLAGPRGSVQDHLAAKGYLGFVILNINLRQQACIDTDTGPI